MSAAQALTSGMLALSGSVRSNDAVRTEKGATSFRDELESASRSSAEPPRDSASASEPSRASAAKDRSNTREDRTSNEREDDEQGSRRESDATSTPDQTAAKDLSLVLAALGGTAQSQENGAPFDDALVALKSVVADPALVAENGAQLEQGPVLPGEPGEVKDAFDAAKLLALLKTAPDVSRAPGAEVAVEGGEFTATVLGQETHLAVEMPAESGGQKTQEAGPVSVAQLQASAAEGSPDTERAAGKLANEAASEDGEPGSTRRGGAPTQDTRSSVVRGFAEQGVGGQDGRQQEGSGSSNGNSQQSSTGVFATMVSGARSQSVQPADEGEVTLFDPLSEQIAAEVRAELRADGLGETSSDGVVKVLHLQLKPANLGAVTVRLALKDNAISIHMETQHRDTLAVIEREREALAGALSSAGYTVDGITAAPQSDILRSSGVQTGFGDQGASGSQGQVNQGQGLASSSGEQGRQGRGSFGGNTYSNPSDGKATGDAGARGNGVGLYV
ncbi:flagellar hook-length control protein FliK [Hyphomicrobium sp. LHD-15]|uniref:flagellar hook-length control protein FliK n=1 Tax=Hyphomicrobium sp. LHD-15 TaxID=3072142 RepID=UPI0028100AC1|nr:flagellar hook-length control protein FliK [Hyphomicrobium sp. LHD-15]MDQ8699097.1 flagellar hook-length control protein FliK [Hyphomicrobium sp. LHD-15]